MANKSDNDNGDAPTFSPAEMAKARNCFTKAAGLVDKKNWDYAIEWFINGLEQWPEAVEEGHKPCRAAALFRGGKKVSFTDGIKYKTSGKDAKKAMLNAETLLSKDPRNIGYMEALFKNAGKAGYVETIFWIGEMFYDTASRESKPKADHFATIRAIYEELGDRFRDSEPHIAIKAYDRGIDALTRLRVLKPTEGKIGTDLRDMAGKLTIVKGKYGSADSFKDSMSEGDEQRDLHDKDRLFQADDRMEELIAGAREQHEADPSDRARITALVDLLCRRERNEEETDAIGILVKAYKANEEYRYKLRADDIRMKQLKRQGRALAAQKEVKAAQEHLRSQLTFEMKVFRERIKKYPTDLKWKNEYGKRLFRTGQYDEAIPVLQEARNEPKTRHLCSLYIGRCFFAKGFYSQAADTFRGALSTYELPEDDLGKKLNYWLGRSLEAEEQTDDALKIYGQLIQWDYNYRKGEVRDRIEKLRKG